jgi:hypothetical protein
MIVGAIATLISVGLLVFLAVSADTSQTAQALRLIELFKTVLSVSVLAAGVGASYLLWGEDVMSAVQLIASALLYFFPLYFPLIVGNPQNPEVYGQAAAAVQQGGMIYGLIAICVTMADVVVRVRDRAKIGVKLDQLKYGRGVKEEPDKQNILLGKCWQLPFCRKFVRERCPIYHAKTTCWKELVGCMCEESVIRNAMENRAIPKDALLAAQFIPRNSKLTNAQKRDRCKTCVIYNEHQRHKYKVTMPTVLIGFIATYAALRIPLLAATENLLAEINGVVQTGTLGHAGKFVPPHVFVEMLLVVFFVIVLTYSMKILEYLIFNAKV